MIGFLFLGILFGYIILAKFIINKVYKKYGTKKARNIALAVMILIPTWDVILGYPIYKVLCWTQAGMHIYKTVDNVEGFYVGNRNSKLEPHEPYEGYKYIDYKEMNYSKPTGKYYRSYWIDSNTSKDCIHYGKYKFSDYADAYRNGRCIVKKEIAESEVSRWELEEYHLGTTKHIVHILDINKFYEIQVKDRYAQKYIGQVVNYSWAGGWINKLAGNLLTGYSCSDVDNLKYEDMYIRILKPNKEGK